ncbi:MAG: leucine-rich repeat protein [Lachnospiraceae bacterium]|nr:leucine-rich repeat protein [Lachnospiraceae bacterium]
MKRKGIIRAPWFFVLTLGMLVFSAKNVAADGMAIRTNMETAAEAGEVIIGVEGYDCTSAEQELLDLVNQVRYEACHQGNVPDPRNKSRMLTPADYVPIKLGQACSRAARIRAAEASVRLAHVRPNGKDCLGILNSLVPNAAHGENLAWATGAESYLAGWINEKADYVARNTKKTTGHYESLINPNYRYTGMATFNPVNDNVQFDWSCTAGQYSTTDTEIAASDSAKNNHVIQQMPVKVDYITAMDVYGPTIIGVGTDNISYDVRVAVTYNGMAANTVTDCKVYDGVTFTSSDPDILSITETGLATAVSEGKATITVTLGGEGSTKKVQRQVLVSDDVTITGIETPPVITVESNKIPRLPGTVKAILSNGDSLDTNVSWDAYNKNDLLTHFTSRDIEVPGKASGTWNVTQTIHVKAATIQKVYVKPDPIETPYGKKPELPKTVHIDLSNNYTWGYNAKWDSDGSEYCNRPEGGTFTLTGYATPAVTTDEGTKTLTFSATLIVLPEPKTAIPGGESGSEVIDITDNGNGSKQLLTKGTQLRDAGKDILYRITSASAKDPQVELTSLKGAKGKVTIPDTVKVRGIRYKVTSIAQGASAGNKKITQITIGKNVVSIGKNAFKGCSKVKKIIVKTKKLKKKKVKAGAFAGLKKTVTVKVPASKLKSYGKIFRSRGLSKKAKIRS